ncbi:MAG: hypothetical protein LBS74_02035 [Oscillospiraceae bacterium]|jgi:hypothetical protein|nr:hypothetical protein [Oscillospiraceae bacterium]
MDLSKWQFYDIWLLMSLSSDAEGCMLNDILRTGDLLNHTIFLQDELNYGMSKLIYNGYAEIYGNRRFRSTEKAEQFLRENNHSKEGIIAKLMRLKGIFCALPIKSGCPLTQFFTEDDMHVAHKKNKRQRRSFKTDQYK